MKKILTSLGFLAVYALTLFLTFTALSRFFEVRGPLMFVLTGLLSIVLLIVVFGTFMSLMRFSNKHHIHDMHDNLTHILNEIANGNFNVFIEPDPHAPHGDIAEALNDMARKLGTMETMRQDFISNVSHEIQSPLTSIAGFAALLKSDELSHEQRRHYADIIESESRRLSGMSENLLKLSALDQSPLAKTQFRLDKQLQSVVLALEPQWAAKNIELGIELQPREVFADEHLLSQVWVNLLGNAIKFTPEGGAIQLTMKSDQIMISDTGIGISDEDKVHIFERFYKVDKARERSLGGNGLGLSIAKKIVELHDGKIIVESEIGVGTKFYVIL